MATDKQRITQIGVWILAVLLAAAFLAAGGRKLYGTPEDVANFARWGYPGWVHYVVGSMEVLAAILVITPKTRRYGAALVIVIMLGALSTHLRIGEFQAMAPAAVLLGMSVWLGYLVSQK